MADIRKSNTSKEEYPQNLLDAIAGEWEEEIPADFPQTLAYVLAGLTEREQSIIEMRFKQCMTYEQTGREFNVTRERIRQIEAKAIRKLRHPSRLYLIKHGVRGWVADVREQGRQEAISEELKLVKVMQAIGTVRNIYSEAKNFVAVSAVDNVIGKIVDEVPAADAAPVVHGHWIRQDESFTRFKCSNPECGIENCSGFENYCPNCGAKMCEED